MQTVAPLLDHLHWPQRLRRVRAALSWTNAQLADALGVSDSALQLMLSERMYPAGSSLTALEALERRASTEPPPANATTPTTPTNGSAAATQAALPAHPTQIDGAALRRLRTYLGVSQSTLAPYLGVGLSSVSRWELGRAAIPPSVVEATRKLYAYVSEHHQLPPLWAWKPPRVLGAGRRHSTSHHIPEEARLSLPVRLWRWLRELRGVLCG